MSRSKSRAGKSGASKKAPQARREAKKLKAGSRVPPPEIKDEPNENGPKCNSTGYNKTDREPPEAGNSPEALYFAQMAQRWKEQTQ